MGDFLRRMAANLEGGSTPSPSQKRAPLHDHEIQQAALLLVQIHRLQGPPNRAELCAWALPLFQGNPTPLLALQDIANTFAALTAAMADRLAQATSREEVDAFLTGLALDIARTPDEPESPHG